ncbi:unnamed protein product [Gordionus sp. m RMFG-2023]
MDLGNNTLTINIVQDARPIASEFNKTILLRYRANNPITFTGEQIESVNGTLIISIGNDLIYNKYTSCYNWQ